MQEQHRTNDAADGVGQLRDVVHSLYQGVRYFQNDTGTRRREKHGLPCAVFTKPNNDQKDYVQVYYAEFPPNRIINAEVRI